MRRPNGSIPPLTPAQGSLVAANLPLARWLAHRWTASRPWLYQEYVDGALLGLIDAARGWDGLGLFGGWASICIRHAMTGVERGRRRDCRAVELHSFSADFDATPSLGGSGPARLADDSPDFDGLVAVLPEAQRRILTLRYDRGCSWNEIGRQSDTDPALIRRIARMAIATLGECKN